ncbi:Orotate phosphoribosyltransferase [Zancudomyces culisetae]|uniref:orotate phosphoribosyltransferase n=1 Tax=Zancudomyces culisetae TaxID=1213189 RepID=A0A1R1PPS6_ZANCU|nr:Orotate phosphoribosyltransferase [Zancudomyces culisetae]OMH82882.1 Orotate phosphoribosyltransferase [Zancudomyces culisetae]OMH83299.1 Orotate phosphoribosyltransferase [Zancudomyces culisetae]|eukprot:OMH79578.1 Orotate phosphoribosyltransferase [Zancudomyces culisetae]
MKEFEKGFIELATDFNVLRFGEFKLKSGRISPYFFNAGQFNTGKAIKTVGQLYSQKILDSKVEFDLLFGPAYKGIPLVTAVSSALSDHKDCQFMYDRKEVKDHGEGGNLVGATAEEIKGKRILIVDDVITAGTAIKQSVDVIVKAGGIPVGVVVAIDRQEVGSNNSAGEQERTSAVMDIQKTLNIPVYSIVKLDSIIEYIEGGYGGEKYVAYLEKIREYRRVFGV